METEVIFVKLGRNLEGNGQFKPLGSGCGERGYLPLIAPPSGHLRPVFSLIFLASWEIKNKTI